MKGLGKYPFEKTSSSSLSLSHAVNTEFPDSLSGHFFLSSINPVCSSRQHPVSTHVFKSGQSTLASPCIGVHKRALHVHPYFSSSIPHVFFVLVSWFLRWEVGGRTATVLLRFASRKYFFVKKFMEFYRLIIFK